MTFDVLATGSAGNAVVLNGSILIDCGVSCKALEEVKRDLKLVLLTHAHGDHFKPRTVRALHRERPALRWGCCDWMVGPLLEAGVDKRVIDVLTPGQEVVYQDLCYLTPEALTHDVPNCGYLIEANHTRTELEERVAAKHAAGEYAYEVRAAANHLSQEQALDWLYQQMGPNSQYVFLHQHQERGTGEHAQ